MLLIDYAFFVKESTKITWEGRGYPVTKNISLYISLNCSSSS